MNIKTPFKPMLLALAVAGAMSSPTALYAGERESLEQLRSTTMSLIELLVQEGVLSKSKADTLIREAEAGRQAAQQNERLARADTADAPAGKGGEAGEKVVRVQYVPEHVKKQLRDEIKQEVMARAQSEGWAYPGSIPEWLNRIEWEADMRLRYELDSFSKNNAPAANFQANEFQNANISNTTEDRNRFRVRARLGAKLTLNDWLDGGIRMVTGSNVDPISPNQTLETQDSKFSFALDRAYLRVKPASWASISGGRFENPFFHTDLVWDPDLAFDGVAASFNPRINEQFSAFGTLGAFILDEQQASETNKSKDKWFVGAQAGMLWKSSNQSSIKLGAALYDFQNVEGQLNGIGRSDFSASALSFRSKGNSTFSINKDNGTFCGGTGALAGPCGLASQFRELNLTGQIDVAAFDPVHVILTGDYVRNIGFDAAEIARRTGSVVGDYKKENEAYQIALSIGTPKVLKRHDWQVFGAYKRIEADSVLDALTDSDFHLGGTDTKGWIVGGSYGVDKNAWLSARWFSADQISGLPLSADVLLLDLNAKF